jgi:hypothetical protein
MPGFVQDLFDPVSYRIVSEVRDSKNPLRSDDSMNSQDLEFRLVAKMNCGKKTSSHIFKSLT